LKGWYEKEGFIPGSLIHISRGETLAKCRSGPTDALTKEWCALYCGRGWRVCFAMLKQTLTCSFVTAWQFLSPMLKQWTPLGKYAKTKPNIEKITTIMMRELAKLNPQGQVHAQELYAAVNLVKRCPPGPIIELLFTRPWAIHLGDLYFRLDESKIEGA
jgi:hypothetical protein